MLTDANRSGNCNAYSYGYRHGYTQCYTNGDSYTNRHRYGYSATKSYTNSHCYAYNQANAHCQARHNTEGASYPTAAPDCSVAAWRQTRIRLPTR